MSNPFEGARPYQVAHIQNLLRALLYCGAALDASEVGTGKTFTALIAARILEITAFVMGPKAARAEWELAAARLGVKVVFVNYEKVRGVSEKVNYFDPDIFGPSFTRLCKSEYGYEKLYGSGSCWVWSQQYSMIIFDEGHKCSGSTTVQGKLLRSAKSAAQYVMVLSATLAESPTQLKNVGIVLGLFTAKDSYKWMLRHGCTPGIFGGLEADPTEIDRALLKINAQIFPKRGARMRRSAIPGFPETLIEIKLVGDGKEETARLVEEIAGCHPSDLRYGELRQILDGELVESVVELTLDSIENKRKVVIFPRFTRDLQAMAAALRKKKLRVGCIDGTQIGAKGDRERAEVKRAFQQNELDVALVNQGAGSAALSLHDESGEVERDTYIFPVESGRTLKQILGRVHRSGGAFSRQFLLGFAGTIHERILLQSSEKISNIAALNDRELDSLRLL